MNNQRFKIGGMDIIPLPAFRDNYLWLVRSSEAAIVVDPGDAQVVEDALLREGLPLAAILLTHHHADHVGGVAALAARRAIPVFGPAAEPGIGVTHPVAEGDLVVLPGVGGEARVLEVPGHTATHVAYLVGDALFCGDTLFSAGCGRLLGGTAAQLHASLQRLAALPDDTRVFCAHEYTLANLAFASVAEPDNEERDAWRSACEDLRARGLPTVPTTIMRERAINPFLRTAQAGVIDAVARHAGRRPADDLACFAALRAWKDTF